MAGDCRVTDPSSWKRSNFRGRPSAEDSHSIGGYRVFTRNVRTGQAQIVRKKLSISIPAVGKTLGD